MNCRYFACPACYEYTDAGYRWAYFLLEESGIVHMDEEIDVDAVLANHDFWHPPDDEKSLWLCSEIFPSIAVAICIRTQLA